MTRAGARLWPSWAVSLGARAVFVAVIASAAPAQAQVPGEEIARRAFEDGVVLEKKGDFAGALAKFKESEQIKATLGNRYHKAYCLEMTGKLAAALIEYEIVDKAARDAKKSDLVEATRVRVEPLRVKVPQVAVRLVRPAKDAEVTLDGTTLAPALLDGKPFRLDPGEHVVAARAPGHDPWTKQITAGEGTTTSVDVILKETVTKPVASPAPAVTPEQDREPSRSHVLPILTTAGAVILVGAGVGAFVLAGSEQDELEKTCRSKPTCDDDKGATRTLDALALGSWIGGAGLAALSIVLWTSTPTSPTAATRARLAIRSSWVGLEGRF